ncbi:MAG: metal ABC transporter ATP-binding protein, partial [Saprospiraceae bacterium]|nr:metal ABC transporter ATP-binding protein [Saprospiraceae bacterium]
IYFLSLAAGYIYGVIGPNGAGKSTLFKAILGLTPLDNGSVRIMGASIREKRKEVVYVPQKNDVDLSFPATVMDVVLMGRYPHKKVLQRLNLMDKKLAISALEEMGIANLKDRQIGELSGGQQQRAFIARALCQAPDLFLLDEPFVGVDMTTERKIMEILKKMAAQGKTVLIVHHDLSSVANYFDKVIMINQRIVAVGDTLSTFTDENIARTFQSQLPLLHKISRLGV